MANIVITEELRQEVIDAVASALGDAYDCTRVWSAWGYGTMSEDDFSLVAEDASRLAEIADAAISAVADKVSNNASKTAAVTREMIGAAHDVMLAKGDFILSAALLERIYLAMKQAAPPQTPLDTAGNTEKGRKMDWKPIETAPTDGTSVLLLGQGGKMADGHYWQYGQPDGRANPKQFVWPYIHANPTHWMPRPELPSNAGEIQTKEQVELAFRAELQALLNKYGAELEAKDHWTGYAECGEDVRMTVTHIMMPRELTAENGAKAALLGKFVIYFPMTCCCHGADEDCEVCRGSGEYMQRMNVPWTTIKQIYKAAVNHFGQTPSAAPQLRRDKDATD